MDLRVANEAALSVTGKRFIETTQVLLSHASADDVRAVELSADSIGWSLYGYKQKIMAIINKCCEAIDAKFFSSSRSNIEHYETVVMRNNDIKQKKPWDMPPRKNGMIKFILFYYPLIKASLQEFVGIYLDTQLNATLKRLGKNLKEHD